MTTKNSPNHELSVPATMVISNILKLRKQKGYTQEYMAHALDITERAYQKIEQGKNKSITVDMIDKIANIFEMNWVDLIKQEEKVSQMNGNGENNTSYNHINLYPSEIALTHEIEKLQILLTAKDEKISFLEKEIENLKEINALLKGTKG